MATSRKRRLPAAELRRGIGRFEARVSERRDDAAREYHGKTAQLLPDLKVKNEHRWATYSQVLQSLHTFTDGEFGEEWDFETTPPAPEASGGEA